MVKMRFLLKDRYSTFIVITTLCFLPPIIIFLYAIVGLTKDYSWFMLSLAILSLSLSCMILFTFLTYWEDLAKKKFLSSASSVISEEKNCGKILSLQENNIEKSDLDDLREMKYPSNDNEESDFDQLEQKYQNLESRLARVVQEYEDYKLFGEEQLKQKNIQLMEAQITIEEQKEEINKRQNQIHHLDGKINDLSYEIKNLIQKSDLVHTPAVPPYEERSNQIENSGLVAKAWVVARELVSFGQKLTSSNYYEDESSRYKGFSQSQFSTEQRKLFTRLNQEKSYVVLLYSLAEQKLVFVSDSMQEFFGIDPSHFLINYASYFVDGGLEWQKFISQMPAAVELHSKLHLSNTKGKNIGCDINISLISKGLFRNYLICILY